MNTFAVLIYVFLALALTVFLSAFICIVVFHFKAWQVKKMVNKIKPGTFAYTFIPTNVEAVKKFRSNVSGLSMSPFMLLRWSNMEKLLFFNTDFSTFTDTSLLKKYEQVKNTYKYFKVYSVIFTLLWLMPVVFVVISGLFGIVY